MAQFTEAFSRLRQDLDQARRNRMELMENLRHEAQQRCESMALHLAEQAGQRRADFAAWRDNLRGQIHDAACATNTQLANLAADLHQAAAAFQRH